MRRDLASTSTTGLVCRSTFSLVVEFRRNLTGSKVKKRSCFDDHVGRTRAVAGACNINCISLAGGGRYSIREFTWYVRSTRRMRTHQRHDWKVRRSLLETDENEEPEPFYTNQKSSPGSDRPLGVMKAEEQ